MKKVKLIWDFRGRDAQGIAKHHCIHLKEFAEKESLTYLSVDLESLSEVYVIAYIIVLEKDMLVYRDALKPMRGEYVSEK